MPATSPASVIAPVAPSGASARLPPYVGAKIRNISFLLIVLVVFNHAKNLEFGGDKTRLTTELMGDLNLATAPFVSMFEHFINGSLGRICNPFFFLASGYLLFLGWERTWASTRAKLGKRFFSILVPYLVWCVLGMVAHFVFFFLMPNLRGLLSGELLKQFSVIDLGLMVFNMPAPYPLWYMRDLIILIALSPILLVLLPVLGRWAILLFLGFHFLNLDPGFVDRIGLTFFGLGATLAVTGIRIDQRIRLPRVLVAAVWLGGVTAFALLSLLTQWDLHWLYNTNLVVGVAALWMLYDHIPESTWPPFRKLADHRFFVFVAHEPLLTALKAGFFLMFVPSPSVNLFAYLLLPVVVIGFCSLMAITLHRRFEKSYLFLSGGR